MDVSVVRGITIGEFLGVLDWAIAASDLEVHELTNWGGDSGIELYPLVNEASVIDDIIISIFNVLDFFIISSVSIAKLVRLFRSHKINATIWGHSELFSGHSTNKGD